MIWTLPVIERPLKVLYLSDLTHPFRNVPWMDNVISGLDGRHDVRIAQPGPLAFQVDWPDVVIDFIMACRDEELADRARQVRLWQVYGVGLDGLARQHWREAGIPVCNCPGSTSATALAECAMMLTLMVVRRYPSAQISLRAGVLGQPVAPELDGMILGIVGFGASGRELAVRARPFGMRIHALDELVITGDMKAAYGLEWTGGPGDLDDLLRVSDVVALHVPLTDATSHLIDGRALSLMKPGAHLVNVARGGLVDQNALAAALTEGRIAGAGLDVFELEPPPLDDPFFASPNLVILPHTAGVTHKTAHQRAAFIVHNIENVARGLELESRAV
jgi:phosphoglycerate dehydrogenase-like enzyme